MKMSLLMVALFWSLWATLGSAQPYGVNGAKNLPRMELDGKLQAWQAGMMRIVSAAGQPVMFALPQTPNGIRFTADVEPGLVKRGMYVRIQAPVGANGQFLEPVNFLTLFTPDRSRLNARSSPAERSLNVPGVYRVNEIQRPAPGEMGSPDVRIVGTVLGMEQNILLLQCGQGPMKIELAENPTFELNSSSLDLAKPGDSVTGSAMLNPSNNQLVATNIMVRAAKKLSAPPSSTNVAAEGVKLRVKEKVNSKLKTPEMKEESGLLDKPEMKEIPDGGIKAESSDKPLNGDSPLGKDDT